MKLLIGDFGVGKSLLAERLLQQAIADARLSADAPIPVFLKALELEHRLEQHIRLGSGEIANPRVQGAFVVVDDVHEVGIGRANQLLSESRILTGSWPNTSIIMTSRPIPGLGDAEETIAVEPKSEEDATAIISIIAGFPVTPGIIASWSQSIRETIRRPLFAVLMGSFLKDGADRLPYSGVELLEHLINLSLADKVTLSPM